MPTLPETLEAPALPACKKTLFASVYPELTRVAARQIRCERDRHAIQTTDLVHEAYLRIARKLDNADHFERFEVFALASSAMKHVLIDQARARKAKKRDAHGSESVNFVPFSYFPELHEALKHLAVVDPRQARIVQMRFFGGWKEHEIAVALGISLRSVKRNWAGARNWLYSELRSAC